jgi:hypothetical protein
MGVFYEQHREQVDYALPAIDLLTSIGVSSPNLTVPSAFCLDAVFFKQWAVVSFFHLLALNAND